MIKTKQPHANSAIFTIYQAILQTHEHAADLSTNYMHNKYDNNYLLNSYLLPRSFKYLRAKSVC